MRGLGSCLCIAVVLGACASPMSTFQTGRTTPKGRVEALAGIGTNLASSFIGSVIDSGELAADKVKASIDQGTTPTLSEDETRDLMRTAFSYALLNPLPLTEIGLRYGILDRWDAGLAYTTSGFRFETKVQLLRDPVDLAVGLQGMRQVFEIPVPSFLKDIFQIEDLSRTDLSVPVVVSHHFGQLGFLYGGPKFFYSFLQAEVLERVSSVAGRTMESGRGMWGVGGLLGGGIGYKYVYFVLEVNVLYYAYSATLLDTEVDLSGVDVYPAMGLKINFHSEGG